ncbi:MAG: hypothetical protein Q7V62_17620 [Actinomycetota bacterium]|nr:hypothetical protein [Actinomycetota bacterium]
MSYDWEYTEARLRHAMLDGAETLPQAALDYFAEQVNANLQFQAPAAAPHAPCARCGVACVGIDVYILVVWQLAERDSSQRRVLARGLCHWEWQDASSTTAIHGAFLCAHSVYLRVAMLEYFCGTCRPHVDDLLCQLRMETCSHEKRAEIIGLVADVPELIPDLAAIVGEYLFSDPAITEPPKRRPRIMQVGRGPTRDCCICDACAAERAVQQAKITHSSYPLWRPPEEAFARLLYGVPMLNAQAYNGALDLFFGAPSTRLRAPPRDDTVRRRHQRLRDFHRDAGKLRAKPSRFTRRLARLNDAHMKRIG